MTRSARWAALPYNSCSGLPSQAMRAVHDCRSTLEWSRFLGLAVGGHYVGHGTVHTVQVVIVGFVYTTATSLYSAVDRQTWRSAQLKRVVQVGSYTGASV